MVILNDVKSHLKTRDSQAVQSPLAISSVSTSSDCISTTALLLYRAIGAGIAWTIGVDSYKLLQQPESYWENRIISRSFRSTKAREIGLSLSYYTARNIFTFASFLGTFGLVSCSAEIIRGRHDKLNPFLGGFAAGVALMPAEVRTPRAMLISAGLCGFICTAFHFIVPPPSDAKTESEVINVYLKINE